MIEIKPRKTQQDRFLKRLSEQDRRYQRRLRTLILKDLDYLYR